MANQPGGEPVPGAGQVGAPSFGPQPHENQKGPGSDERDKPKDDKFSPDVVALQKKLIETENDKRKLQEENARLRTAPAAAKKDSGSREDKIPHPNSEEAFNTETRVPITKSIQTALGRTIGKFLGKWTESGPQTRIGLPAEIREKGWLRRLAQIPILGWLAPAGMGSITELGATKVPGFYNRLTNIGAVVQAGKEITLASVNPALQVGLLGGLARGAVDGIRWAVMKEKTMHLFARKLVDRANGGHLILDEASAVWNTVMADQGDIAQLMDLSNDFKSGMTADHLMMDKRMMLDLIKSGFNAKLQKMVLERVVSTKEGLSKLNEKERLHLQNIETAYQVAEKLFDEGFTPAERAEFLQNELPQYLQRKEVLNHLKAMGKRAFITGFKTSLIGMAASLLGTLSKTGLFADWGNRISNTVTTGVTNITDYAKNWYNGAKGSGWLKWFNNLPIQGTGSPAPAPVLPLPGLKLKPVQAV